MIQDAWVPFGLDSQAWLAIALSCAYLAFLIWALWRLPHCPCCSKTIAKATERRHK